MQNRDEHYNNTIKIITKKLQNPKPHKLSHVQITPFIVNLINHIAYAVEDS